MTNQIKNAVMIDPAASYWLKRAINELDQRDPCDALHDIKFLKMYIEHKLNEVHVRNAMDICNLVKI